MITKEIIETLKSLKLNDYDYVWNYKLPDKSCEYCLGTGVHNNAYCECVFTLDGQIMEYGYFKELVKKVDKTVDF